MTFKAAPWISVDEIPTNRWVPVSRSWKKRNIPPWWSPKQRMKWKLKYESRLESNRTPEWCFKDGSRATQPVQLQTTVCKEWQNICLQVCRLSLSSNINLDVQIWFESQNQRTFVALSHCWVCIVTNLDSKHSSVQLQSNNAADLWHNHLTLSALLLLDVRHVLVWKTWKTSSAAIIVLSKWLHVFSFTDWSSPEVLISSSLVQMCRKSSVPAAVKAVYWDKLE